MGSHSNRLRFADQVKSGECHRHILVAIKLMLNLIFPKGNTHQDGIHNQQETCDNGVKNSVVAQVPKVTHFLFFALLSLKIISALLYN